jgi:hypothetical protein
MLRHVDENTDIATHMSALADDFNTDTPPKANEARWALREGAGEIGRLRDALNIAHKWMGSRQPAGGGDILAIWRREMKMIEDVLGPHRTADTLAFR